MWIQLLNGNYLNVAYVKEFGRMRSYLLIKFEDSSQDLKYATAGEDAAINLLDKVMEGVWSKEKVINLGALINEVDAR